MSMLWFLFACAPSPTPEVPWCSLKGEALGTSWSVRTRSEDCASLRPVVEAPLAEVDARMSTWRDDSELSAVRRGGRVHVTTETLSVVRDALALAEATEGAFDPTVQPLMEVWGFHSRERTLAQPDEEALQAARERVGYQRVQLGVDAEGPWIDAGGTALDLSSIAKGHAVDRIAAALSRAGLPDHMVEVGGEVRVSGRGPSGLWRLGVDAPEPGSVPGSSFAAVVGLTNAGLATSGNYRNLVEVDGRRVHHTMDPRTGQPAHSDVASATVIAPTCREADALATAVMVLGSEAGLALLSSMEDVEGLLLVSGDELVERSTPGMQAFLP